MSLLNEIKKDIKDKFPVVYNDNNKFGDKFKYKLYTSGFWNILIFYFISVLLVSLYSIYVDFHFFKLVDINFDDNIKTFATIVITLVSMNLFVTNLLFTHLKDERDDIQSIIDEKINFKFITYVGFSTILCILLLYFFSPSILNNNVKSNILILIFWSFIFYIFQLVGLYNIVFNFIHKSKRLEIIKEELVLEFSRAFYMNYTKKEFSRKYIEFIEHHFRRFDLWSVNEGVVHINIKRKTNCYLKDVNIKGIAEIIRHIPSDKYYHSIELDKEYMRDSETVVLTFLEKPRIDFIKFYKFSSKKLFTEKYNQQHLNRLLKKVENNTLNNKFIDLKSNLADLDDIYTKYIDLQ